MSRHARTAPIRILLVGDPHDDRSALQKSLGASDRPFELTLCAQAEAMHAHMGADRKSFDIVVVDDALPGMTGLEAYRQLRRRSELPPFVLLIDPDSASLAVEALEAGMYDCIVKDPGRAYLRLLPLKLEDVRQRHRDRLARLKAQAALQKTRDALEKTFAQRTADLGRMVTALQHEIEERMQTEQALRDSEQALRTLSLKIVETQENERRLMAKELHDSIGASLAAIKFAVEEKLERMADTPPEEGVSLETVVAHIRATIKEVRRISTSLRPSMLDDLGLLSTVQWYCRSSGEMYAGTRIETEFELQEVDIPDQSKIVIYRIVQEALNNALKHSAADSVKVRLEKVRGGIRMCVRDNGSGFDFQERLDSPDPLSGYGLRGMFDRAEVVGARLTIDSAPDRGTAVCLDLPWKASIPAADVPTP